MRYLAMGIGMDRNRNKPCFNGASVASNNFLVANMKHAIQNLRIDLDSFYILNILMQLNMVNPEFGNSYINGAHIYVDRGQLIPVRLRDIVAASLLPRESVRRKLKSLLFQQMVEKSDAGRWTVVISAIDKALFDLNQTLYFN